jgi:hypothetical protein
MVGESSTTKIVAFDRGWLKHGNDKDMEISRFGAVGNAFAETQKIATAGQMSHFSSKTKAIKGAVLCIARDSLQSNVPGSSLTSYFQAHTRHPQRPAPQPVQPGPQLT